MAGVDDDIRSGNAKRLLNFSSHLGQKIVFDVTDLTDGNNIKCHDCRGGCPIGNDNGSGVKSPASGARGFTGNVNLRRAGYELGGDGRARED